MRRLMTMLSVLWAMPLAAQTFTPRDSALRVWATQAKAASDTNRLLVQPGIRQACATIKTGVGTFRNQTCVFNPRAYLRDSTSIANLFAIASVPAALPTPDTVRLTVHDTVFIPASTQPAAVASLATSVVPSTLNVGETAKATVVAKDSAGNVLTGRVVTWSSSTPTIAVVSNAGIVTAVAPGNSAIKATVEGKSSYRTVTVIVPDSVIPPSTPPTDTTSTPPPPPDTTRSVELPRVFLNTAVSNTPSAGRTLNVPASGNLQTALDSARPGDRVLLAAGATYAGNFSLCTKTGGLAGGWITVQSAGSMPLEAERISPAQALVLASPKILSPNTLPVFQVCNGAQRWRLIGLEVTVAPGVTSSNALVVMGDNAYTDSMIPKNIILDRMYVHGTPTLDIHRCVTLNADSTSVIDSYISDCHAAGIDAQAVFGWNMRGPLKIVNNYLEASTEVVGTGGADPAITGLIPADIEIRGNHITRPMSWKGGPWLIKTLIEFKNARRVWIVGNVLENNWPQAQAGYGIVLYSVNQSGRCTWCETSHVTIERNVLKNVAAGFQLTAQYDATSVPMNHIAIRNNVAIGVTPDGGDGFLIGAVASLAIDHNTILMPSASRAVLLYDPRGGQTLRHTVTGNLFGGAQYPLFMATTWPTITDTVSRFAGNVVAQQDAGYYATKYGFPATGNQYPTSFAALGLVGGATAALSLTATLDQLALSASSPYVGAGADIAAVKAAIANVVKP